MAYTVMTSRSIMTIHITGPTFVVGPSSETFRESNHCPLVCTATAFKKVKYTNKSSPTLKGRTSERCFQTTTNGRAVELLAWSGSLSGYQSKQQPCSTLLDALSRENLHSYTKDKHKYVNKLFPYATTTETLFRTD
ncbi:hypothetical protein J6590_062197 [Homalodisca vitripennis]|nr:hypothetical protein J6590_062197 [Homalodisca vitripennis]